MHRGYIKLWRRVNDSKPYRNRKVWALWTYLLLNATHRKIEVCVGNQKVELLPGQIISGRNRLAKELGLKPSTVWFCLETLKSWQQISIKPSTRYSVITIINWDRYQGNDTEDWQQPRHQPRQRPSSKLALNKNNKNNKKLKEPASGSFFNQIDVLIEQVQGICQQQKVRFNPRQWVMVQTRNGSHPGAIADALSSMAANKDGIDDFWAWGDQVVKVQSGNYAEADHRAQAAGHRQDLADLLKSIGG